MKKLTKKEFKLAIGKLKTFSVNLTMIRHEIAKLTLDYFPFQRGGNIKKNGIYTLNQFCKAAGLPPQSVRGWRREYVHVVSKMKKGTRVPKDTSILREVMSSLPVDATPKKVQKTYAEVVKRRASEDRRAETMMKTITSFEASLTRTSFKKIKPETLTKLKAKTNLLKKRLDELSKNIILRKRSTTRSRSNLRVA